jgi:hypothetical protein
MSTEPSIEARVGVLESTMGNVRDDVAGLKSELNTDVAEIRRDVKDLRDKLAARPSWAVCTIIAGLSFSTAALGSTLLTLLVQTGG